MHAREALPHEFAQSFTQAHPREAWSRYQLEGTLWKEAGRKQDDIRKLRGDWLTFADGKIHLWSQGPQFSASCEVSQVP